VTPHLDAGVDAAEAASDAPTEAAPADAGVDASVDAPPVDAADAAPTGVGCDPAGYPSGPYGTAVGAVIANLAFDGLVDANANGNVSDDPELTICLGRYHAAQAPKILVVHWTAAWSSACAAEEPGWVELAAQNAGKAVFLEAMAENVGGQPATLVSIQGWAKKFGVANDLAVDPSQLLAPYLAPTDGGIAWPGHLLVRTDTMRIVAAHLGGDADAGDVQAEIDDALASDAGAP
jgi:hypothetical protein